jgi:hypothetical protein
MAKKKLGKAKRRPPNPRPKAPAKGKTKSKGRRTNRGARLSVKQLGIVGGAAAAGGYAMGTPGGQELVAKVPRPFGLPPLLLGGAAGLLLKPKGFARDLALLSFGIGAWQFGVSKSELGPGAVIDQMTAVEDDVGDVHAEPDPEAERRDREQRVMEQMQHMADAASYWRPVACVVVPRGPGAGAAGPDVEDVDSRRRVRVRAQQGPARARARRAPAPEPSAETPDDVECVVDVADVELR